MNAVLLPPIRWTTIQLEYTWALYNQSLSATDINNAAHWSCINCACGVWPLVKHGEHTEVTLDSCSQQIQDGNKAVAPLLPQPMACLHK